MAILVLLLTSCLPPGQTPEQAQVQINTAVAAAIATQQALIDQAVALTLTSVAQNASPTPVAAITDTPTGLVFPTLTPIIPTVTPIPSGGGGGGGGGGGSNSSSAYSCSIISEKPYDGAHFKPGDSFDKTWTIKNTGTVTWEANWDFEHRGGTDMSPTAGFKIGKQVKPGGTITLVIEVVAPDVAAKDAGKTFVMTWSLNKGSHFCTPYVAIKVYPPGTDN
jgi:hypothetical protein